MSHCCCVARAASAILSAAIGAFLAGTRPLASGVSANAVSHPAIPMEALCDSPGLAQLAWKAAVARDLPVLMPLIAGITLVIRAANAATEVATA